MNVARTMSCDALHMCTVCEGIENDAHDGLYDDLCDDLCDGLSVDLCDDLCDGIHSWPQMINVVIYAMIRTVACMCTQSAMIKLVRHGLSWALERAHTISYAMIRKA